MAVLTTKNNNFTDYYPEEILNISIDNWEIRSDKIIVSSSLKNCISNVCCRYY